MSLLLEPSFHQPFYGGYFNQTPADECTGRSNCWCEDCEGLYFTIQHLPADCRFDGDDHTRYYGARQNRWDERGFAPRPR